MYFDHRTGYVTFDVIIFFFGDTDTHAFSPEYFAAHSEHVVLETIEE